MAQHTEDHDMVDTTTSQPVNLALRSSSSNAPSDDKTTTTQAVTTSSSADSGSDDASTSEEDSDEESEEEQIATLKPGVKPDFSSARKIASGAPSLEDRLKAFLPQLAEANSKLQKGGEGEHSMEVVGEDEPHIEMDLGLGVLEETKGDGESEGESDDEGEDGEGEGERKRKEKDVMAELMGKKENVTAGIEEVG
jgi:hypothetical protein